jgi:hypothetical protein
VIFQGDYPDELALELMNEAKMKMAIWSNGEE